MYNVLIDCLQQNSIYFEEEIKTFHNTSCTDCTKRALNVVTIKTEFYRIVGRPSPKSVNAILFKNGNIFFIEMTSYYQTYPYTMESFVEIHSGADGMIVKILGTIKTIEDISNHYSLSDAFKTFISTPSLRKIKSILLTEMDYETAVIMKISNLDKINAPLPDAEEGEIAIFNCEQFESYFK